MKLQLTTDYAIRILCYLHEHNNRLTTAADLSKELGITYLYFMKISGYLKQSGLLKSVQGCNGGYQLAKTAENISLYDVVKVIEGDITLNRCLEEDRFCSRDATEQCSMHRFLKNLQQELISKLDTLNISQLCEQY